MVIRPVEGLRVLCRVGKRLSHVDKRLPERLLRRRKHRVHIVERGAGRQLVGKDLRRRRHQHHMGVRMLAHEALQYACIFIELRSGYVLVQFLFEVKMVASDVNAARVVKPQGAAQAGRDPRPHVAKRELIGHGCLEIFLKIPVKNRLQRRCRHLLQYTVFVLGKRLLREHQNKHAANRQQRDKKDHI